MKEHEEIKDSLNILGQLATQLDYLAETWMTLYENQHLMKHFTLGGHYNTQTLVDSTSGIIQNLVIIKANAFLDEFNQEFTPAKFPGYKLQILSIKKWCKPIMSHINKWSGIKAYRNEILSHNHRRKGESLFNNTSDYKIPYTNYDNLALCKLIFMIAEQLKYEFEEIMKECLNIKLAEKMFVPKENSITPEDIEIIRVKVEKLRCNR